MNIPLVDEVFLAIHESLRNSREEVKNARYGQNDTIMFEFRGKTYQAPEPRDLLFGFNSEADKSICLRTILNRTAKIQENNE